MLLGYVKQSDRLTTVPDFIPYLSLELSLPSSRDWLVSW